MIRLAVDPAHPDPRCMAQAAEALRRGQVLAIPTDTLYGLAVDPFSAAAVRRVFTIKGRDERQPMPIVAGDAAQVARIADLTPLAERLAARFWPGPLTLVMRVRGGIAVEVTAGLPTVGVRVPAHAVTRALCVTAQSPLTATSANISGQPPSDDPDVIARELGGAVDLLVDAGRSPGGPPSTLVDVTGTEPRLIRPGAISWEEVCACAAQE